MFSERGPQMDRRSGLAGATVRNRNCDHACHTGSNRSLPHERSAEHQVAHLLRRLWWRVWLRIQGIEKKAYFLREAAIGR